MRRVQPSKTIADETAMPKPASAVSITDTDAEYEDIYSRIDDLVPSSSFARDDNSFPQFAVEARQRQSYQYGAGRNVENVVISDREPVYATVDETIKMISQEVAVQDDDCLVMGSPSARSRVFSQNCRVQDCINGTKDALAKALLYTKIDITKTIRYRLKMAQMLNMSNRNRNTTGKDADVTAIDYVDNDLYDSVAPQQDKEKRENNKQNETHEQSNIAIHEMEHCRNIIRENESEQFGRLPTTSTSVKTDWSSEKSGGETMPETSPYETIPADFDYNDTDYSLKEDIITRAVANGTAENNIGVKSTKGEVGNDENIYMCINENHYSMERTVHTKRTKIYEEGSDYQTRETSL